MNELTSEELNEVGGGVEWASVGAMALRLGGRVLVGAAIGTGVGLVVGVGLYVAYEYSTHK